MFTVVQDAEASNESTASSSLLDEIARDEARQMRATALQAAALPPITIWQCAVARRGSVP